MRHTQIGDFGIEKRLHFKRATEDDCVFSRPNAGISIKKHVFQTKKMIRKISVWNSFVKFTQQKFDSIKDLAICMVIDTDVG